MYQLQCMTCGRICADMGASACPHDGGFLNVLYDSAEIQVRDDLPGIWRYAARLPSKDPAHIVSLGDGDTPLPRSRWLGAEAGLPQLYFKNEGLNPTGSYKDRIASVGMSTLRQLGLDRWATVSSGNAGAAISAYGAQAGADGYVFTLERAPRAKIAQIIAYGPRIMSVRGMGYDPNIDAKTWDNARKICEVNNWLMLITARRYSPQSMEGAKTIAYEIGQQLKGVAPDVVYVPVGGGGLISSIWKGFREWRAAGQIDRLPRMVAIQPAGCDPLSQAWREQRAIAPLDDCTSAVSGIILTAPPDGDLVLNDLRESDGWAVSISDDVTYQCQAELARREGLFVEPAAAITWAAVKADLAAGRLTGDETVVCVLTGIGFKDSKAIGLMTADAPVPLVEVDEIMQLEP